MRRATGAEPPGAQFVELLGKGTPDEVDAAVLQRTAVGAALGAPGCAAALRRLLLAHGLAAPRASAAASPQPQQLPPEPLLVLRLTTTVYEARLSEEQVASLDCA